MSQFNGHKTVSHLTVVEGIEFIRASSSRSVCLALCWNALSTRKKNSSCREARHPFVTLLWTKEKYYIMSWFPFSFTSFCRIFFSFSKQAIMYCAKALPFEISAAQPNRVGAYNPVYSPSAAYIWVRSMMSQTWA